MNKRTSTRASGMTSKARRPSLLVESELLVVAVLDVELEPTSWPTELTTTAVVVVCCPLTAVWDERVDCVDGAVVVGPCVVPIN